MFPECVNQGSATYGPPPLNVRPVNARDKFTSTRAHRTFSLFYSLLDRANFTSLDGAGGGEVPKVCFTTV